MRFMTIATLVLLGFGTGGFLRAQQDGPGKQPPRLDCEGEYRRCIQNCFDQYSDNQDRCRDLWCDRFLFFRWCQEEELGACLDAAEMVKDGCLQSCAAALAICLEQQAS